MNIVKIKEGFASEYAQYNDKYCYFVNWKWIIPFDVITQQEYIEISQKDDINCLGREIPHLDYIANESGSFSNAFSLAFTNKEDIDKIIDYKTTNDINSIDKFIEFNKFSITDNDLTFEYVRKFRTWLADILFNLLKNSKISPDVIQMLNYYSKEMTDNVVVGLHLVSDSNKVTLQNTQYSTCGCKSSENQILLSNITTCDPIIEYRKSIYNIMVKTFSDIDFWKERDYELLIQINEYLDYIIKKNLPLSQCEFSNDLYDCGCLSDKDYKQNKYIEILKNLQLSFEYIAEGKNNTDNNIIKHKNFIGQSLNNWAVYLYEKMRW